MGQRELRLHLDLMNKEGLPGDSGITSGSFAWRDHEIVKLKSQRGERKASKRAESLGCRRADVSAFRELLGGISWDAALTGQGAGESWWVFKDHLPQAGAQSIPLLREMSRRST